MPGFFEDVFAKFTSLAPKKDKRSVDNKLASLRPLTQSPEDWCSLLEQCHNLCKSSQERYICFKKLVLDSCFFPPPLPDDVLLSSEARQRIKTLHALFEVEILMYFYFQSHQKKYDASAHSRFVLQYSKIVDELRLLSHDYCLAALSKSSTSTQAHQKLQAYMKEVASKNAKAALDEAGSVAPSKSLWGAEQDPEDSLKDYELVAEPEPGISEKIKDLLLTQNVQGLVSFFQSSSADFEAYPAMISDYLADARVNMYAPSFHDDSNQKFHLWLVLLEFVADAVYTKTSFSDLCLTLSERLSSHPSLMSSERAKLDARALAQASCLSEKPSAQTEYSGLGLEDPLDDDLQVADAVPL